MINFTSKVSIRIGALFNLPTIPRFCLFTLLFFSLSPQLLQAQESVECEFSVELGPPNLIPILGLTNDVFVAQEMFNESNLPYTTLYRPFDTGSANYEVSEITEVVSNALLFICYFASDAPTDDGEFDITISGETTSSADLTFFPRSSYTCAEIEVSALALENDLNEDEEIDFSFDNFGAGWTEDFGVIIWIEEVFFAYEAIDDSPDPDFICQGQGPFSFIPETRPAFEGIESFVLLGPNGVENLPGFNDSGVLDVDELEVGPTYTLVKTVEINDECSFDNQKTFTVLPSFNATIEDAELGCITTGYDLRNLFTEATTEGGVFTLTSPQEGASINNNILTYLGVGCIDVTYTVENECGVIADDASVFFPEAANPIFQITSSLSCWTAEEPLVLEVIRSSPEYTTTPTYQWEITDMVNVTVEITGETTATPSITLTDGVINTYGEIRLCLTESLTTSDCGDEFDCERTFCRNLSVTIFDCNEECNSFQEPGGELCPIETNEFFSFTVFDFEVSLGSPDEPIVESTVVAGLFVEPSNPELGGTLPPFISCTQEEVQVSWDFGVNEGVFSENGDPFWDEPMVDEIPGVEELCNVAMFPIPLPGPVCIASACPPDEGPTDLCLATVCLPIDNFFPFGFLNFAVPGTMADPGANNSEGVRLCDVTPRQFILDPLRVIIDESASSVTWADTDGDGVFDTELTAGGLNPDGSQPAQSTAFVPNNIQGEGTIRVRNLASSVESTYSPCISAPALNLLEVLPIDAVPIAGSIISTVLSAGGADVNIVPSAVDDLSIRVINDQDPEFLNFPDQYVFSTSGDCSTPVNWSTPIAVDGCTRIVIEDVVQTGGPTPGSMLVIPNPDSVGTDNPNVYEVEYTATACNEQDTSMTFRILITDGDPVIRCPQDITLFNDVDQCSRVVTGISPLSGIGCNSVITWAAPGATPASGTGDASGSTFPLGTTTVTYTLTYTNENGVAQMNECSFNVTVEDAQRPDAVCVDFEVQLDDAGMAIVNPVNIDGGSTDNCTLPENLTLTVARSSGGTITFGESVTFDCSNEGPQTVTLSVTDEAGNERRCLSLVTVTDFFEGYTVTLDVPEICLESPSAEQLDFSNYVTLADSQGDIISHTDENSDADLIVGLFGISSFISSEEGAVVTAGTSPDNPGVTGYIDPSTGVYTPGSGTGFVTISYVLSIAGQVTPGFSGLEGCFVMTTDVFELRQPLEMESPECACIVQNDRIVDLGDITGGLEPYTIQYSGVQLDFDNDGIADDTDGEFTFTGVISGSDGTSLTVDPKDFTQDLGQLLVDYTVPTWSFTVVDARGCELFRSGSCDNADQNGSPEIICADLGPVTLTTGDFSCAAQYNWTHALPTDNCDVIAYTYTITNPDGTIAGPFDLGALLNPDITNPLPSQFNGNYNFQKGDGLTGVSTVTYYAEDATGNFGECSFTVTVTDDVEPVFVNCPEQDYFFRVGNVAGCDATVNWSIPVAQDNCGSVDVELLGVIEPGSTPMPGTYVITYLATDRSNNFSECVFNVVVEDNQDPVLNCPQDVFVESDPGVCEATVNNIALEYSFDNCPFTISWTSQAADVTATGSSTIDNASGAIFPVGLTTVTYTITETDDFGNGNAVASCEVRVTVTDGEMPQITCPPGDTITTNFDALDDGNCASEFTWTTPTPTDNCGVTVFTITFINPDESIEGPVSVLGQEGTDVTRSFDRGTTTVRYRVEDAEGNAIECTFLVKVEDDENPEIPCDILGPVALFTETDLCEAQYNWTHPIPEDNCEVVVYNYTITNPDGSITGPFDLAALINPNVPVPDPSVAEGEYEFQHISPDSIESIVTYYAEDAAGNFVTCSFTVTVTDDDNPFFINCPEPAVVVNAIEDQCVAFANYSLPLAADNCSVPVVTQVDDTGLSSGDLYPVGITINTFEAVDATGNTLRCDVKVIVNDIFLPPTFECPADVVTNTDPGDCGAIVNNIAPGNTMDNCIDNVTTVFQITDADGNVLSSGFDDASGTFFDLGVSTVRYVTQDMPLLLITEVTHAIGDPVDGTEPIPAYAATISASGDFLEITNFNRAVMDVSCLSVSRYSAMGINTFAVPTFTLLEPGETLVLHFGDGTDAPADNFFNVSGAADLEPTDGAAYVLSLADEVLDVAAINGYDLTGLAAAAGFTGTINVATGAGIIRTTVWDTDSATDFVAGEACNPTTIGSLNPQLAQPTPNGTQTAIQAQPTVRVECEPFTVTVSDDEDPTCGLYSDYTDYEAGPISIGFGECVQGTTITITDNFMVADLNLTLVGTVGDLGNLTVTLISPEGREVNFIEAICAGVSNVNFTLDGDAAQSVVGNCGSLNTGGSFIPVGDIESFNGELVTGDWTVRIAQNGQASEVAAEFSSILLSISGRDPYDQGNVDLENDPGVCGAEFTFFQAVLFDNCAGGSVLEELIFAAGTADSSVLRSTEIGILAENTETTFFFPVGTTTVRYTLTDAAGNQEICYFEVLVRDTEDPVLTCPADVTIQLASGECETVYIPTDYTAEDNCAVTEIFSVPDFNDPLPIGVTEVDFTIRDAAGNDTTCTYVVTVLENIPMPPVMACITNINVHLGPDCEQEIIPEMVLTGNDFFCFDEYTITLFQEDANGNPVPLPTNFVNTDQVGQLVTYQVNEDRSGAPCWGYIDVGFFEAPEFICPADATVSCNADLDPALLGEPILLSCALAGASVAHADTLERFDRCDDPRATLRRTWLVTDNFGNSASCVQTITIEAFDLDVVRFPSDFDDVSLPALNCIQVANDPSLTDPTSTGFPFVEEGNDIFNNSFCSASYLYADEVFPICDGSFQIIRTWRVTNTCQPILAGVNPIEGVQVIRVLDNNGPQFECPADETISTGPFDCNGAYVIPTLDITAGCSNASYIVTVSGGELNQLGDGTYVLSGLEIGSYTIQYEVEDECGNFNSCQYNLTVNDQVTATAICEDGLNVSLNTNGVAALTAADVDGGSDDLCGNVDLAIRREYNFDPITCDAVTAYFSDWGPLVDVNCCDLAADAMVTVELRVTDEDGNVSTCWTDVLIEDKLAPVCAPPQPMQVSCLDLSDEFPEDLTAAFNEDSVTTVALLNDLFGTAIGIDNCGEATVTQTVVDGRTDCGTGSIFRRFTVTDEQGLVAVLPCTQTIEVTAVQDYTIEFPADRSSSECVEPDFAEVTYTDLGCGFITTSTSIDTFEATADECYKLRVTYEMINWCEYDSESDAYLIPRDADNDNNLEESTFLHILERGGAEVAVLDRDANRDNNTFIAFLDFQDEGTIGLPATLLGTQEGTSASNGYHTDPSRGFFRYHQFIKVYDDVAPSLVVDGSETEFCDEEGDCLATAVLTFSVDDLCSPDAITATVTLDANINTGADNSYTLADFVADGGNVTGNTVNVGGSFTTTLADLPFGTHAIRIVATDGCGNTAVDLIVFEVTDCKAPTPICINGLTATLMPNGQGGGMAAIWADDFIASAVSDCSGEVEYAIYRSAFAADQDENWAPSIDDTGVDLTCDDEGMLAVRIYAIDPAGQFDYCETTLFVQVFQEGVCAEGTAGSIAGLITAANTEAMTNVTVNITDAAQMNASTTTDAGFYQFGGLELGRDYTVQPGYNPAPNISNISTGDLVMITRHILGIQALENVYQVEASDVTRDGNTNVVDIIAIRRLILGLTENFPATPSWQFFVAGDANMAQVQNINNLSGNVTGVDYVGVEMGNVSGATAGLQGMPEGRSSLELTTPDLELKAGNTYEVVLSAAGMTGFQGTLELAPGLEVTGLEFAEGASAMANLNEVASGLVAMSFIADNTADRTEEAAVATLMVRATVDGKLSEFVSLSDRITTSEGYTDTETTALGLDFKVAMSAKEFRLAQNTPNPFTATTTISFLLPETGLATLKFQNIQGQTILVREIEANAGYNTVNFTKADFKGSTGVMTYTLTVGEFTATRKMIVQ